MPSDHSWRLQLRCPWTQEVRVDREFATVAELLREPRLQGVGLTRDDVIALCHGKGVNPRHRTRRSVVFERAIRVQKKKKNQPGRQADGACPTCQQRQQQQLAATAERPP